MSGYKSTVKFDTLDSGRCDGRVQLDIVDDEWRAEKLPHDEIEAPSDLFPDPEADNADESHLTIREQEQKWVDLALSNFGEAAQMNTNQSQQ